MIISLDNFDEHGRSRPILNSPRSIQACRRQGIQPEELIIKTIQEIRHIYKDGMNDKKSLEIKLQHHEMRRKNKLQVVRKERSDIINNIRPVYRPNHSSRRQRVEIIEVEDKLEKKRIMDEVKAQLKQKQLQMKEMKIANKINKLQQQKKQAKLRKQVEKIELQKRNEHNQLKNEILHETKVNNYLFTEMEKEQKIQQALLNKKNLIEQVKKEKEEYYDKKSKYVKQLENKVIQEKRMKVESKFNELDQRLQEKYEQEQAYRKNLEEQKRKDAMWKQTKLKEVEIQQKKRQSELMEALMHKQIKKQEYIGEIQNKKEKYYGNKKQEREQKSQLVKTKMMEDQKQIQKRRRIMELVEEQQRRQEEQRKMNEKAEIQSRKQQLMAKQKQRIQRLKQEEKMNELNAQYILEKKKEKLNQIQQKKKQMQQKQKQKMITKQLKQKEAEQNRIRLQKIKQYQKMEEINKYNNKMKQLEEQKKVQRNVKIVKSIDKSSVESKIISEHSLDKNKNRQNREASEQRIKVIKAEARKNPIQVKQILKKEEINKLIQNLKIQCNKEEYAMMKEQQHEEKQRQQLEKTAENIAELRRLQKIHGVERARFQQKLTAVMKANLEKVQRYKNQLLK